LQGIVLVGTLLVLALFVFAELGGTPGLLSVSAAQATPEPQRWATLDAWAVPIAGSLFTQEIISRAVAAKTPEIARRSAILGGVVYLSIGSLPVLLGLLAREFLPELDQVEQVLPLLSRHVLGELGFVLLAGALISAILSTVDSALLACGAFVVQNVIGQRAAELSDGARLRVTRLSVAGLGGAAFVFALLGESVHALVAESSALGSAGIFVAGVFGLFTKFGGARAALASLLVGAATYVYAKHAALSEIAYLWSLLGALLAYAAGARSDRNEGAAEGGRPGAGGAR
jgi:Na+/proline symporter